MQAGTASAAALPEAAATSPGDMLVYHKDGLGSVRAITDIAGNVIETYETDEFGVITSASGSVEQPFGYTGEMRDAETGLVYLRSRYYDPETARFFSRDSEAGDLGSPLSLNRYTYALDNPLKYVDPSGHVSIIDPGGGGNKQLGGPMGGTGGGFGGGEGAAATAARIASSSASTSQLASEISVGGAIRTASTTSGRSGKQGRLRELLADAKLPSFILGWLKQEQNAAARGARPMLWVPPGYQLAHRRGFPARPGHGYENSDLQEVGLHRLQHKHERYR